MVLLNFATLLYYDPAYLTEKGGADGPPQWLYFTCVQLRQTITIFVDASLADGQLGYSYTKASTRLMGA
jgi:hypothetical protein